MKMNLLVLVCALTTTTLATAELPAWWRTLDETSSRQDRIILTGEGERITWAAVRDGDDVDHWNVDFELLMASLTVELDPNDPSRGTWVGTLPSGTETGYMYILEGAADKAVLFETSAGDVLDFFELSTASLELAAIGATPSPAKKCVCWPPQGATCMKSECNVSDTCGTGGTCMYRFCSTPSELPLE